MEVVDLPLAGLKLIRPRVFPDARGMFLESYHEPRYQAAGIGARFVQDNHSRSVEGTLRGLHYQSSPGQAKLVRVASGRIYDVDEVEEAAGEEVAFDDFAKSLPPDDSDEGDTR